MFVTSILGITYKQRVKYFATKCSMREEIYRFTKESTQEKSHTHVNSAPRCLQQLETETTTREDISRTNLTFAILPITAEQNITENISSSSTFSASINLWSSINLTWRKSSQQTMKIMKKMKARSARTQMNWCIRSKMSKHWMSLTLKDRKILIILQIKNATTWKRSRLRVSTDSYADQKELTKFRVQKCCTSKADKENT